MADGHHEHMLSAAQFHRREGRPNKTEHEADGSDEHSSAPRKQHIREHKASHHVKRHGH